MAARSFEKLFCAGKSRRKAGSRRRRRWYQSQNSMSLRMMEAFIARGSGLIFMMRPWGVR